MRTTKGAKWGWGGGVGLCLLLALLLLESAPAWAQAPGSTSAWVRLGSPGPLAPPTNSSSPLASLAVSEDWPTNRFLLANTTSGWRRSLDGGASWSSATVPPDVSELRVMPGPLGQRVVFARTRAGLLRSADDGSSWQSVQPAGDGARLIISPTFSADHSVVWLVGGSPQLSTDGGATWIVLTTPAADGSPFTDIQFAPQQHQLFAVAGGQPYRSTDGGVTWTSIGPPDGPPVEVLFVSASFAVDQTIFATVATSDPPDEGDPDGADDPSTAPAGVLVTLDGGTTWTAAQGLDKMACHIAGTRSCSCRRRSL